MKYKGNHFTTRILYLLFIFTFINCSSQNLRNYYGKEFKAITHQSCEMYEDGTSSDIITTLIIKITDSKNLKITQSHTDRESNEKIYKWKLKEKEIILENFVKEEFDFKIYSLKLSNDKIICNGKRFSNEKVMEKIFKTD